MMASDRVLVIAQTHPRACIGMIGTLVRIHTDGATVYFDNALSLKDGSHNAQAILKLPLTSIALIAESSHDN